MGYDGSPPPLARWLPAASFVRRPPPTTRAIRKRTFSTGSIARVDITLTFSDPATAPGETYYYARVLQDDGQVAWPSPIRCPNGGSYFVALVPPCFARIALARSSSLAASVSRFSCRNSLAQSSRLWATSGWSRPSAFSRIARERR